MSDESVRLLLIADTHLGFDLPFQPRIERRRRGHDFFGNFRAALQPALQGTVDLVVHGGDIFYRSKVPPALVDMALAPLLEVAEHGVPVFIVPGNHERSRIPLHLWSAHPNLHVFDGPKTYMHTAGPISIALSGFPFARDVRDAFADLVLQTGYREVTADVQLLCMHQTVEGAQVGPSDYTFRSGPDVIRGRDIPDGFTAILCGHIHRAQTLTHDLAKRPLAAAVVYPGSIERTSFAERHEDKGYTLCEFHLTERDKGRLGGVSFVPLPARPMRDLIIQPDGFDDEALTAHVKSKLHEMDPDAVVRVQLRGPVGARALRLLGTARLRELAPSSMNVHLALDRTRFGRKVEQR